MKIIAGLGNPGTRYDGTPHNIGFEAVDAIAAEAGAVWEIKKAFNCLMARCVFAGCQVLLVKPQTFMNLSGDSLAPAGVDGGRQDCSCRCMGTHAGCCGLRTAGWNGSDR